MTNKLCSAPTIFICNRFESWDLELLQTTIKSGAIPVVNLSFKNTSNDGLFKFASALNSKFIVALPQDIFEKEIPLPDSVEYIIVPSHARYPLGTSKKLIYEVTSLEQAIAAQNKNAYGIIAKGNEAGGLVGEDPSFILFQKLKNKINIPIWVQGGIGLHTSAALISLGASGVLLDYQLALFPELKLQEKTKSILRNCDGSETKVIHSHRVWIKPGTKIGENIPFEEFTELYSATEIEKEVIALGQDIGNASYYYNKFKKIDYFISAIKNSITGHIRQAKYFEPIKTNNGLANFLGTRYPIAQGPMTRVSDVPEFAQSVAEAGALPFLALALLGEEETRKLLTQTKQLMDGKSWGVGILGFAPPEILNKQLKCIEEIKPTSVIIAGGRSSQTKSLEKIGIKVFLHVPSSGLLDNFLKEGAKNFIFEGRECGGHVGPLSSFVLWEKQICRLLQEDDLNNVNILFAGGIHDALSASMVSIIAAPLVARGAKIGIVIGSAYLFTKEAIQTGAILKKFQQEILKGNETTLLESSPGHVVRCLKTPFADYFSNKKKELYLNNIDSKTIGHKLEDINIGRLRTATKGLERIDGNLIYIKPEEQLERGLYMVGQVATLRDKTLSMLELHENIVKEGNSLLQSIESIEPNKTNENASDIAIIGMACIFPEASNMAEYWKNILQSKNCIRDVPDSRWDKNLYFDPKAKNGTKSSSKWGGFIPTIYFDPVEFGIPPQSLAAIEPVQLLSLKVTKDALKDAGYDKKEFDRENTSVVFGVENGSELSFGYELRGYYQQYFGEMPSEIEKALPALTEDSFAGILSNVLSGRIANRLNLGGKNLTVDAACGSSLAAIDTACLELITGRTNMVLAGAADLHNGITDYLKFSSAQALTSEGQCKTFDQSADGISLGEGIGVVVLKRLTDAEFDGDRIYAIIKSVSASSDGKTLGLTAPNKKGQIKAFERAYSYAGISASEVGLIEAHGTGTIVGDKTELSSMTEVMCEAGTLPAQIQLGSVKTQIGHTKCAAGLAGLIRATLSIYHGIKPPTLNLNKPNIYYNQLLSPFVFNDKSTVWLDERRIAGVSAFGFGGTNFHAVLENKTHLAPETFATKQFSSEICVFRAENDDELNKLITAIRELINLNNTIPLKDISFTLAKLNQKPVKLTIVAETTQDLNTKLEAVLKNEKLQGIYKTQEITGKVAFLFSGQGSQRINMARDLFVAFTEMRHLLNTNPEFVKILFPDKAFNPDIAEKQKETIKDTRNAQPLLGIVDYAIAKFLISFGIKPDMLSGHSYGELPALCIAGVINEEDLVPISKNRAVSILEAVKEDPGAMVALSCNEEEIKNALAGEDGISMVNHNSPLQWVIAGGTKDISRICNKLKTLNKSFKRLDVACAFHSPLIADSQQIFEEKLNGFNFNHFQIPVWSNTNAEIFPLLPDLIKKRLCEHLVKPVKFCEQIQNMYENGARIFIETGPGNVLTKLTKDILNKDQITLSTEQSSGDGVSKLIDTLAQFIACGKEINFDKLFEGRLANTIDLQDIGKYTLSKTIWKVDGARAVPLNGKLPAHGAQPVTKPLTTTMKNFTPESYSSESDKIVLKYLENIQTIIKAQHSVMLNYLGNEENEEFGNIKLPATGIPGINPSLQETNNVILNPPPNTRLGNNRKQPVLDIKTILLETVSEKTGYPLDMLDMNMDLEADLSIDSIKRVEIINVLKEKFDGLATNNLNEGVVEKLASIKTLNGLEEWISVSMKLEKEHDQSEIDIHNKEDIESYKELSLKEVLLSSISEKTGYPIDMLDMNMDMEADLSIDSIKRIEVINDLKKKIGGLHFANFNEDQAVEKLASIKTLNGLIDWLVIGSDNSGNKQYKVIHDQPIAHALEGNQNNLTLPQITEALLDSIAEKTGYPKEMLEMEMDMEADLSIDSIKRIEIINTIKSKINLKSFENSGQDIVEKLASIKTLQGLAEWIYKSTNGLGENKTVLEAFLQQNENSELSDDKEVLRFAIDIVKSQSTKSNTNVLQDKRIAITDDGGKVSKILKANLEYLYAKVDIVDETSPLESYDGLVFLDFFGMAKKPDIITFFSYVQKLNYTEVGWIYAVTDIKYQINKSVDKRQITDIQGYNGFLNSLGKEWKAICRTIHLEDQESADRAATLIVNELCYQDSHSETFYRKGDRFIGELKKIPWNVDKPVIQLGKINTVLALGGAQGITSEILKQLSLEMPCHYLLVGRTEKPGTIEDGIFDTEQNSIRKKLLSIQKFDSPAQLEKKVQTIYKRNQLLKTIENLEKNGAKVDYYSLDLKNEEAFADMLKHLYQKHGNIDGVIHATGYLDDKFFHKKTLESFEKVFSTKVNPLKVLAKHLKKETKFCILFSSIASVAGNKGQVDYAAANSVLDQATVILDNKIDGRVVSINWGPWKGKGMISEALEKDLLQRGITSIPITSGSDAFIKELKFGKGSQIILMTPVKELTQAKKSTEI